MDKYGFIDNAPLRFLSLAIGTFMFDTRIGLFANPPNKEARKFIKVTNYLLKDLLPEVFLSPAFILYFKRSIIKKFVKGIKKQRAYVENTITRKLKELNTDISAQGQETFSGWSHLFLHSYRYQRT